MAYVCGYIVILTVLCELVHLNHHSSLVLEGERLSRLVYSRRHEQAYGGHLRLTARVVTLNPK